MSREQNDTLRSRAASFPDSPGVYFMKDRRGRIIYVGKAKVLANRVKSYVQRSRALDPKTRALVGATAEMDYIATRNEVEALVLECNLIKEHRPRYNIRLKDDKRYPFIKLTANERYPRLLVVRSVEADGAEYFGPYTDARAVRRTMRLIGAIFPLRSCAKKRFAASGERECLNFHIGRCRGPCTGRITEDEYGEIVGEVRLFLRGRSDELVSRLKKRMHELSSELRYEEAAVVRNQVASLEAVRERQFAAVPGLADADVVALAREGNRSCGTVVRIREGKVLGSETFMVPAGPHVPDARLFTSFFELYYHDTAEIPPAIYTMLPLEDRGLHEQWLSSRRGARVRISNPRRGDRRRLIDLAAKNASLKLASDTGIRAREREALGAVKRALGLPAVPSRIEAYDISAIQGSDAVGAMVAFENGRPHRASYRRFRIKGVGGIDDCAMLEEVLTRRLKRLAGRADAARPDLILVDGGAGQVAAARRAMDRAGIPGVPVFGLAKKHEELYRENSGQALRLPRRSEALRLLQRVRNEVHRFAVNYHRTLRAKRLSRSALDEIQGIGEKRKNLLLSRFGSVASLREATIDEIASVPGIGGALAEEIHRSLHR